MALPGPGGRGAPTVGAGTVMWGGSHDVVETGPNPELASVEPNRECEAPAVR